MMNNYTDEELVEFLQHSNWIESETSPQALEDAMQAWDYIMNINTMEVEDVLEVHRRLMENLDERIAGQFRSVAVYVGGREGAKYYAVPAMIEHWVEKLNEGIRKANSSRHMTEAEKDALAKEAHIRFEHIHPFEDGNGRSGRILMNWHRLQLGLPLLIIHEGDEQLAYYQWFKNK